MIQRILADSKSFDSKQRFSNNFFFFFNEVSSVRKLDYAIRLNLELKNFDILFGVHFQSKERENLYITKTVL